MTFRELQKLYKIPKLKKIFDTKQVESLKSLNKKLKVKINELKRNKIIFMNFVFVYIFPSTLSFE